MDLPEFELWFPREYRETVKRFNRLLFNVRAIRFMELQVEDKAMAEAVGTEGKVGIDLEGDPEQLGILLADLRVFLSEAREAHQRIDEVLGELEEMADEVDVNVKGIAARLEVCKKQAEIIYYTNYRIFKKVAATHPGAKDDMIKYP